MKTLYLNSHCNIIIDSENQSCGYLSTQRESISHIHLVEEPMHVVYGEEENRKEFDVKKDDIIIRFYESDFPNRIIVVKSKDWVKNLKDYNKHQQELKEQWAAKQKDCDLCDGCVPSCATI